MQNRSWLSAVSVILAQALSSQCPAAEATPVQIDLPAQSLADSIQAIARQTNTNILVDPSLVAGRQAPAINQQMSLDQALGKLLQGTGLTSKFVDEKTVVVSVVRNTAAVSDVRALRLVQAEASTAQASSGSQPSTTGVEPAPVQADPSTAAAEQAASDDSGNLEEIVVTAQKRVERLIDVPQSVTVVSADQLAGRGATQFRDYADTIPGLSYQTSGPGLTQISLRGVTVGADVGATVGIYVDDVPFGSSTSFARGGQATLDSALFDLKRIEVLRGPQGTLYGASAMGGILKYVTNRPDTSRFSGEARAGLSDTYRGGMSYDLAGMINVPIQLDKAAVRASAFYSRDGGYIDNEVLGLSDVNETDLSGGRVDLLLTPNEQLSMRITGFAQDIERDGNPTLEYALGGTPVVGDLQQSFPVPDFFDSRFRLISGTVAYDFGVATLTSISSYQEARTDALNYSRRQTAGVLSAGYSAASISEYSFTNKFTQELRLASDETGPFEWLVGSYYTHEDSEFLQGLALRDSAGQPSADNLATFRIPSLYEEYAAFGDVTFRFGAAFDITSGVRYARNSTEFEQIGSGTLGLSGPPTRAEDEVFTYLANARYHVSDRAVAYLRYATGYRPGGPNFLVLDTTTGLPLGDPTFEADDLRSYEAGFKAETSGGTFGFDLAAYYIDWSNIQVTVTVGSFSSRANAPGGAELKGGELSLFARPTKNLTLTGAFSLQRSEFSEAVPSLRAAPGERLPNVPDFTASLGADYEFAVGSLLPTVGATVRFVDERMASFDASTANPQYELPAYEIVDLRAEVKLGTVRANLFIRNAFDERAQLSTRSASPRTGPITITVLQPRTIGVSLSREF